MWKNILWAPIVLIILFLFVPDEMTLLVQGLVFIGFSVSIGVGIMYLLMFKEDYLQKRSDRKRSEIVWVVAKKDEQLHIREVDEKANWRAAHTDMRVYANGHLTEPSSFEKEGWLNWNQPETKIIQGQSTPIFQHEVPQISRLNLLDEVNKFERVLIIGVTDTGKTTLIMKTIETRKGKIIALDPHNEKGKWPTNVKVIGGGRKFELITKALEDLTIIMNQRYDQMEKGLAKEKSFSPIWIVADEWRAAVQHSKEGAELLKELLNEGRKVNIGLILGSQSERVRALGIEGEGDLKESFCIVRLKINLLTNNRKATVDFGEGQIECDFTLNKQPSTNLPVVIPPEEQIILKDYQSGMTPTAIAKKLKGPKAGGNQAESIKRVLRKFGYVM